MTNKTMLSELRIQNLILMESTNVSFGPGLNALTGETGSGKSALIAAIGLIAGERADLSMIRHGSDKAVIEAIFEVEASPELAHLFEESGIESDFGDPVIIRREICANGKGRAFINQQPVHVAFLKTIRPHLFELVDQHANHLLFSVEAHRSILDSYGGLKSAVQAFGASWRQENGLREELAGLLARESERVRDTDRLSKELKEIEEAHVEEGEEEELFNEYTRLTHAEELREKVGSLEHELLSCDTPIISHLHRHIALLEDLAELDPTFQETAAFYRTNVLELEEAAFGLQRYHSAIEINQERASQVSDRLSLINKLLKKYGPTVADLLKYSDTIAKQLGTLEGSDERIECLKKEIDALAKENHTLAKNLTKNRQKAGLQLAEELKGQLRSLNMPDVEVSIAIEQQNRSQFGDDKIEFFIRPNKGEAMVSVKECASGGEISRLLLSIETLLAGKQAIPTIVFDEVDANIGGETATIVGEKLHSISKKHQVLCITHFPQVAMQADHHLRVLKKELSGRTVSIVESVKDNAREKELCRMRGKSII